MSSVIPVLLTSNVYFQPIRIWLSLSEFWFYFPAIGGTNDRVTGAETARPVVGQNRANDSGFSSK